jgi:hypothetical protein
LFLISFANIGCQDEICYSCDKEINSWAKENLELLEKMGRKDLATLNYSKQKAAFRTFSPDKRKQLWQNKFKQIKSLHFSKEELNHLKIFDNFLKEYDFANELTNKQEQFLNSWFEKEKVDYNWTPYFLISGFARLNENAVLNKQEFQKKFPTLSARGDYIEEDDNFIGGGSTDDCDCRWDITCQLS